MTMATHSQAIEKASGNGKTPAKAGPMTLKAFLESPGCQAKLAEVASRYLKPGDLTRLALMAVSRQPDLLKCSQTSILRALMDAASLGVAPGGVMGRGYLVPRMNKNTKQLECSFDPGWRGLCDVARRDARVKKIDAKVVYAGDVFHYEEGTNQTVRHVPTLDPQARGDVIAAYAIAKVEDELQVEVLTRADIEKIRAVSMAKHGPWADWFDQMARKSAVRRLCKYLPYNPLLEIALEHATDVESGERTAADLALATNETASRAAQLAASLQAKAAADATPEPTAVVESEPAAEGQEASVEIDPLTGEVVPPEVS